MRTGLCDMDAALKFRVVDFDERFRVKVDAVCFAGDFDLVVRFSFAVEIFHLVEIGRAFQPTYRDLADVADVEVSVKTVFEVETLFGTVGDKEFGRERLSDGNDE